MPQEAGLVAADTLDALASPAGSLIVTGEPARRWIVEPRSGERVL